MYYIISVRKTYKGDIYMKDYSKRIEGVENMEFTGRLSKSIVLEACKRVENNQPKVVEVGNGESFSIYGNIIISGKTEKNSFSITGAKDGRLGVQGWFRSYYYKNGKVEVF